MIACRDVSCRFGEEQVLNRLSLVIQDGETVCLMGKSGIGKTTLLRILTGLIRPDAGVVTGVPARLACVFQEDRLLSSLNALENIRFVTGDSADERTIMEHLAALRLTREDCLKSVSDLSGGQARRVSLARAVLYGGDLLILDEAFKGLDAETKETAIRYVLKNKGDGTLICVTHDMDEAQRLHGRVIRMEENCTKGCGHEDRHL